MNKLGLWAFLFVLSPVTLSAQSIAVIPEDASSNPAHHHDTDLQAEQLWQDILQRNPPQARLRSTQKLLWPVRQAEGYDFLDIYALAGYVDHDQDKPNQVLDYQCGKFTYDNSSSNHQGTDIMVWPFGWTQMDRNQAEVIAAAAGEVIEKIDGNYDRNCPNRFVFGESNAVFIRHDDGTTAMYLSLKEGSLTAKAIGERVEQGEYLGIIGSSGNSFYPHLHFELRSAEGQVIDPFSGPCNPVESSWENQPPYLESGINLLSTSLNRPDFNNLCDPAEYAPQEEYAPGDSLFFIAFARQITPEQLIRMRVMTPEGTPLTDRTRTADRNSTRAYFVHAVHLPDTAIGGTYTCILNYEGEEYRITFQVEEADCPAPSAGDLVTQVYSSSEVKLTYEGEGGTKYNWQIRQSGTATWTDIPTEAYSFYLRGLQAGTTYEYRMRYWCEGKWSTWSSIAIFITQAGQSCPAVPLDQTTITFPSSTQATIAINLPDKDRYDWRILPPDDQWYNVISQTDSTYTFDGLIANTTYQYRVRVRCGNLWSDWSANGTFRTPEADACDPPAVSDFSVTALSSTEALFQVLRQDKERYDWRLRPVSSTTWITIPSTPATDLVIQGLDPGVQYHIQHRWICTDAWSDWSQSLLYESPPTPCPTIDQTAITITFPEEGFADISLSPDPNHTAFQFRYRLFGSSTWTTLSTTANSGMRIPVLSGAAYDVQVRAFCSDNWSSWTPTLTFNAPVIITCPSLLLDSTSVRLLSPSEVRITVFPPAEVDELYLRFRKNSTTTWTELNIQSGDEFQIAGLSPNTTYAFQIRGQCGNDTTSWSNTGFFTTLSQPVCSPPDTTDFTGQVLSESQIELRVTVDTAQEYQWRYRSEENTVWTLLPPSVSPEALLTGLTANQRYAIQLRQECTNGVWSAWSSEIWHRTDLPYSCEAPGAGSMTTFDIQHDQATLLYTGETGFILQWRFRESGQNSWNLLPDAIASGQVVTPLSPETGYEYQLRIDCGQGWSAWSAIQTFATLPSPPTCAAPETNQINTVLLPSIRAVRIFVEGIDADLYQWRLRRWGQELWSQSGESPDNSWIIEGLNGETRYELQIRVRCSDTWTNWSGIQEFTTPIHTTCTLPLSDQISVEDVSIQSATVQVTATDAFNYALQYRPGNSNTWTTPDTQATTIFQLSGLSPQTRYEVRFRYECEAGWSVWSGIASFTTLTAETCATPDESNIQVLETSAETMTFHIINLSAPAFQLQYRVAGTNTWAPTALRTDSIIQISNLTPQTTYEYRFRYECPSGWSGWSPLGSESTLELVLGPCVAPMANTLRAGLSHLLLQWHTTEGDTRYEVRYRDMYAPDWQVIQDITDTTLAIPGLEPCTAYEWQVQSVCDTSRVSDWSVLQETATTGCSPAYCYSYGLGRSAYIEAITINGSRHESGNNYGYANHTYKEYRMTADATLDLELVGALSSDSPNANQLYWRVWLDRNQDKDFQDSAELVLETITTTGSPLISSLILQLPASPNPYRLRFGVSTQRYPQVCAVESNKYIEDYQLYIDLAQEPIRYPRYAEDNGIDNLTPSRVSSGLSPDIIAEAPFPNPFSEQINLSLYIKNNSTMTWQLFNAYGNIIRSNTQFFARGTHTLFLPAQDLPPGTYTLSLKAGNQQKVFRLVKTQ